MKPHHARICKTRGRQLVEEELNKFNDLAGAITLHFGVSSGAGIEPLRMLQRCLFLAVSCLIARGVGSI